MKKHKLNHTMHAICTRARVYSRVLPSKSPSYLRRPESFSSVVKELYFQFFCFISFHSVLFQEHVGERARSPAMLQSPYGEFVAYLLCRARSGENNMWRCVLKWLSPAFPVLVPVLSSGFLLRRYRVEVTWG